MTHKRIVYGPKIVAKLRRRGITRQQVRWLLAEGVREHAPTRGGMIQRWSCRGYLGKHEAAVIFVEFADRIELLSVQWRGQKYRQEKREEG